MKKFTAILSLVLIAITSVSAASLADYPELEKYVGGENRYKGVGQWQYMPDGSGYLKMSKDHKRIVKYDISNGKELETVLDLDNTREATIASMQGFELSADGKKIMVYRNSEAIYRHSFTAEYYVYEVRTRVLSPLSTEHPRQQAPLFSPDGRMVAFVADNNIYVKKLDYGSEVPVTTDGKRNCIINGVPDWVYEEEFATASSMAWAPDNLTLCYLKYNETDVPMFTFALYEGTCDPMPEYALYPGQFTYKYPVAGEKNSKVTVHSYDVETRKTKQISLPDSQIEYIPRIDFGGQASDRLMVTTLNRDQTRMEIYCVNPRSTTAKSLLVEKWNAWIDPSSYEDIHYYNDFFVVYSCRTGYKHLYQYSYAGALQRTLTSGQYDVDEYYGYNVANGCHYYNSCKNGPTMRVISKVDAKGKITDLSPATGYATAQSWTPSMDRFVMNYSNVNQAPCYTLCNASSGKKERVLEDNAAYMAKWADAPKAEFFTLPTEGGLTLNGFIIKPAGFDPSKRYPVILSQYSGPGSQEVLDKWSMGCDNYFARAGYVVVTVDGRGTGGRGRAFMDAVYKNLGHYESIDQIAAARYAASLPYVDGSKIAIYGWSYGGYESIMAASQPGSPFACAIAVAPVTDWRYYDSIYTERYMLTPEQNHDGYEQSSTFSYITSRQCPLLIMHGTADDNVHLFNAIQYAGKAEADGCWCDMLLFPNKNHSINGCNARAMVYAKMLNYLSVNMNVPAVK